MENKKIKDDKLTLRMNSEDKKILKIFCIENGYKNITEFIMECYEKEVVKNNLKEAK